MRSKSSVLKKYEDLDVVCVVAKEFIGLTDLNRLPELASGLRSVDSVLPEDAVVAIRNMRLMGFKINSVGQIKVMVESVKNVDELLFNVDKETLIVTARSGIGVQVGEIKEAILKLPQRASTKIKYADPAKPFWIPMKHGSRHRIVMEGFSKPFVPEAHPAQVRPSKGPITISTKELLEVAQELDRLDKEGGHKPENWAGRLAEECGLKPVICFKDHQFKDVSEITIEGLCNVLGLPGTGKTTLINLLVYLLTRLGYRTATFTTSIAVADQLRRTQAQYGVKSELMFGSSNDAKRRHAANFGDLIAAEHEDTGFGHTNESAIRFATGCMLEGYVTPERYDQLPDNNPPCGKIIQGGQRAERTDLTCPMIGICGRYEASRRLVEAEAWFGHMSILEVKVPDFMVAEKMTYAELVAQQMDVVFIDEADAAQKALDAKGSERIRLYGKDSQSYRNLVTEIVGKSYGGVINWKAAHEKLAHDAGSGITRHLSALDIFFRKLDERGCDRRFKKLVHDRILNTSTIMGSLHSCLEKQTNVHRDRFYELGTELEFALRAVYFFDDKKDRPHIKDRLHEICTAYSGTVTNDLADAHIDSIANIFSDALELAEGDPASRQLVADHVGVLCHVISCLLHVETILRALNYIAVTPENNVIRSDLFTKDMLPFVAESIAGRLSGLKVDIERHETDRTITGVNIEYQSYVATPRLLPSRLVRLSGEERGPHVVMLSATSYLPESKTYHLRRRPDYILSRVEAGESSQYKFSFAPVSYRGAPVSVSGAGEDREANLRLIIQEMFSEATQAYQSYKLQGDDAVRKIAIVVNSYAQVNLVLDELQRCNPRLRRRTIGIVSSYTDQQRRENGYRTTQEASLLGRYHEDWDFIVFPAAAFGRGVNVVYPDDHALKGKALIGTMFFPIRPHPSTDDMTFLQGTIATLSEEADQLLAVTVDLETFIEKRRKLRHVAKNRISEILEMGGSPLKLGATADADSFAANILVELNQVMGRAIRGGVNANIVFLDAAWAPLTASGGFDTSESSILLRMASIIERHVAGSDPIAPHIINNLYGNILSAIRSTKTIRTEKPKEYAFEQE